MSQLNLFTVDPKQAKFERYHKENPEIWDQFKEATFALIKVGRKHFSADGLNTASSSSIRTVSRPVSMNLLQTSICEA